MIKKKILILLFVTAWIGDVLSEEVQHKEIDQKFKEKFGKFSALSHVVIKSKNNSSCDIMQKFYDIKRKFYMYNHRDERPSTSELIITEVLKCVFEYVTESNKKLYVNN